MKKVFAGMFAMVVAAVVGVGCAAQMVDSDEVVGEGEQATGFLWVGCCESCDRFGCTNCEKLQVLHCESGEIKAYCESCEISGRCTGCSQAND